MKKIRKTSSESKTENCIMKVQFTSKLCNFGHAMPWELTRFWTSDLRKHHVFMSFIMFTVFDLLLKQFKTTL